MCLGSRCGSATTCLSNDEDEARQCACPMTRTRSLNREGKPGFGSIRRRSPRRLSGTRESDAHRRFRQSAPLSPIPAVSLDLLEDVRRTVLTRARGLRRPDREREGSRGKHGRQTQRQGGSLHVVLHVPVVSSVSTLRATVVVHGVSRVRWHPMRVMRAGAITHGLGRSPPCLS